MYNNEGPQMETKHPDGDFKPLITSSAFVMVPILLILLLSALILLIIAKDQSQVLGSYLLFALTAAVVTFGFLGATGFVKTKNRQIGGSAAGFIVILGMLLPFTQDPTIDIRGSLYVDEVPPKTAIIHLLEADHRDNQRPLKEHDQGQFDFKDVRGINKTDIRFGIILPGFQQKVVVVTYQEFIRIEISSSDLLSISNQ